jgi:acetyltransferase-like isoleucine patch superfamily enzyme
MKRLFIFLGNLALPPLNKFLYKIGGVKFKNINKCWIGSSCHFDTYNGSLIEIGENVCISFKVIFVTHFDPTKSIKNHRINNYEKKIIIEDNVFIGAGSIICPGVILKKNSFVSTGSVVKKSTKEYEIVSGNPAVTLIT